MKMLRERMMKRWAIIWACLFLFPISFGPLDPAAGDIAVPPDRSHTRAPEAGAAPVPGGQTTAAGAPFSEDTPQTTR
jgi:hypothetical protein